MENTTLIETIDTNKIAALGKVAVVYGGWSAEREISLQSGKAILSALENLNVDVIGIDADKTLLNKLQTMNFDRVFIALHGPGGEDGNIQGCLEILGIPYTGSKVLASALAMDKAKTKLLWRSKGLPTADFYPLSEKTNWGKVINDLKGLAMVKPVSEGSSLGMRQVSSEQELKLAFDHAKSYGSGVIAEKWLEGNEYTVAIINDTALPVIQIVTSSQFYDYHAKYHANDTEYIFPKELSDIEQAKIKKLALEAYQEIGCQGWGRVDLMADNLGNVFLLEVNTVPGMTSHSLVPMAAKAAGLTMDKLVYNIILGTLN